jgi:hypothetical protein
LQTIEITGLDAGIERFLLAAMRCSGAVAAEADTRDRPAMEVENPSPHDH